jgi:hypothetical protein
MMDCHNFYINNICHTNWYGNYTASYETTKNKSLTNLRNLRVNMEKLYESGWHLSFMGGVERIKIKLDSYGHQEYNNDAVKSNIETKLKQNTDVLGRSNYSSRPQIEQCFFENLAQFDINDYPNNIIELVKEKYPYLIK